jgi:hypothetical protein
VCRKPGTGTSKCQLSLEHLEDRLTPTGSAPQISFAVVNDWSSGFQAQITITDNLSTPINSWSLGFNFDHCITQIWNGTVTSHPGNQYLITSAGSNPSIAPGNSITIGFLGTAGNVTDQPTSDTPLEGSSGPVAPPAPPTVATPAAASASTVTGTSVNLSVLGAGTVSAANLTYSWATTGSAPAPVSFSANNSNAASNTIATFARAGSYTFRVTITDAAGLSTTSSVEVTVAQSASRVVVSPATVSVAAEASKQLSAQTNDQFGNPLAVQPAVIWTVSGPGSVSAAGLYTAPSTAGSATVRAQVGTYSTTSAITVTAPPTNALAATATFTDTNDWGTGFTGNITIANQGSTAINNWVLQFDFSGTISNIWNATIVSHTGTHYVISAASYNANIGAGQSASFGFQASPGNVTAATGPANFVLNGVSLGGPSDSGSSTPASPPPAPAPAPAVTVSSATANEPTSTSAAAFFHTSGNQILDVNAVSWFGFEMTTDAVAGRDYVAQSGTVTFAPGPTQTTVTVTVLKDSSAGSNRTFDLDLSAPLNAVLGGTPTGVGTSIV